MEDNIETVKEVKKDEWPRFTSFFEEEKGVLSMTRLAMFLTLALPLFVWCYTSLLKGELVEMPFSIISLSGLAWGGKIWQKNQENH